MNPHKRQRILSVVELLIPTTPFNYSIVKPILAQSNLLYLYPTYTQVSTVQDSYEVHLLSCLRVTDHDHILHAA